MQVGEVSPRRFSGRLQCLMILGTKKRSTMFFARENKPDENVLLKARLTFVSPPDEEILPEPPPDLEGESEEKPEVGIDVFPAPGEYVPPFSLPAPIFTQEDVDLAARRHSNPSDTSGGRGRADLTRFLIMLYASTC